MQAPRRPATRRRRAAFLAALARASAGASSTSAGASSIRQGEREEGRVERVVRERLRPLETVRPEPERRLRVDVTQAAARLERGGSGGDHDVLDEERPPARADAPVDADVVPDVRLEEEPLEDFGVVEAEEVGVEEHLELGRDVDVGAHVEQEEPGVDEVRLALELARPETRDEAVAALELQSRAGQGQALADPVAEATPGEVRGVEE